MGNPLILSYSCCNVQNSSRKGCHHFLFIQTPVPSVIDALLIAAVSRGTYDSDAITIHNRYGKWFQHYFFIQTTLSTVVDALLITVLPAVPRQSYVTETVILCSSSRDRVARFTCLIHRKDRSYRICVANHNRLGSINVTEYARLLEYS